MLQEASHIKNIVVLAFRHIQCLHLMNSEVAWILAFSGTQVQPQIILDQDHPPDYLLVSYGYGINTNHGFRIINSETNVSFFSITNIKGF